MSCIPPERNKRIRDRISSEAAENTAMIIGIVAGALIAVILVVLLVLKFKSRSNTTMKIDDRKNFGKSPSHSTSNAALLNFNVNAAGAAGVGGAKMAAPASQAPTMAPFDKKPPPTKKSGKDIKEWYV